MPFDAMKGLQEALRDREERHSRVPRQEISEDQMEEIAEVLQRLEKGMTVSLYYYKAFHNVTKEGVVTGIDPGKHLLMLENEKVYFADIYSIDIIDYPR